jgi:hypothetical protein
VRKSLRRRGNLLGMKLLAFLLNLPWNIFGLLLALTCIPSKPKIHYHPVAISFNVRYFWWGIGLYRGLRASCIGNVIFIGPKAMPNDLEHELIHVEQFIRYPFIFPFICLVEIFRNGIGPKNKFEKEAYESSKSTFVRK